MVALQTDRESVENVSACRDILEDNLSLTDL
jgi:hypothetical protein